MAGTTQFETILRGNTAPGVNRWVIEYLSAADCTDEAKLLDIPCGDGTFLDAVKRVFPKMRTYAADIAHPGRDFGHGFFQIDARRGLAAEITEKFDVITCISGVMEFDNTLSFFESLRAIVTPECLLIVTNDNLLSVRDRILYLLFGRHRQYKLAIAHYAPTWKILPLQNLDRILSDAGFEVKKIRFVRPGRKEYFWLPLAALIYPFQFLYLKLAEGSADRRRKLEMYPFISLLSRHYVVICTPRT